MPHRWDETARCPALSSSTRCSCCLGSAGGKDGSFAVGEVRLRDVEDEADDSGGYFVRVNLYLHYSFLSLFLEEGEMLEDCHRCDHRQHFLARDMSRVLLQAKPINRKYCSSVGTKSKVQQIVRHGSSQISIQPDLNLETSNVPGTYFSSVHVFFIGLAISRMFPPEVHKHTPHRLLLFIRLRVYVQIAVRNGRQVPRRDEKLDLGPEQSGPPGMWCFSGMRLCLLWPETGSEKWNISREASWRR